MNNIGFSMPILFGLAKTGKVKSWNIVVSREEQPTITITHGYVDGKQQITSRQITEGKNIGRSNETRAWEQAILDAISMWKKKRDQNYFERVPRKLEILLPMLALEYSARGKAIKWPAYAQPKLNGIRCLAQKHANGGVTFTSRKGKPFHVLDHIGAYLSDIMEPGDIFDGELYNHALTFQEIVAAVKREKEKAQNTVKIEYHIYDYPSVEDDFEKRCEALYQKIPRVDDCPVKLVSTKAIQTEEEMYEYHTDITSQGYEGTMIRNALGKYLFQYRSENLLKLKDFIDAEFEIIGGKEGTGKAKGQCTFTCKTGDGKEFDVRCKGPNSLREEQWRNLSNYIGKKLTVKFQNYSDDGIPVFPVGETVRNYE
jgi:DNA ligase-1